MSVNIYPAYKDLHGAVCHADDWDDESTLNMANGNFYWLLDQLDLNAAVTQVPGTMTLKVLETALSKAAHNRYTDRLKKICAVAHIKRSNLIAFS